MGPTKAVIKGNTLHEAVSGKLIKDGFANPRDIEDYRGSSMANPSIACAARNMKPSTIKKSTSPDARIVEVWASDPTNSWLSRMSSAALPADMNSTRDWR